MLVVGVIPFSALDAAVFTETTDVGELIGDEGDTTGIALLTRIEGELIFLTNNLSDIDLYKIHIQSPAHFSARLFVDDPFGPPDTFLFLFDDQGFGVVADNDSPTWPTPLSEIPAGSLPIGAAPGNYYLGVSTGTAILTATDADLPLDNFGNEIFGSADLDADFPDSGTVNPAGGSGELDTWRRNYAFFVPGAYRIELTLTQQAAVPEPSTLVSMSVLLGLAGLRCRFRSERSQRAT
jgi:hypothetical protein